GLRTADPSIAWSSRSSARPPTAPPSSAKCIPNFRDTAPAKRPPQSEKSPKTKAKNSPEGPRPVPAPARPPCTRGPTEDAPLARVAPESPNPVGRDSRLEFFDPESPGLLSSRFDSDGSGGNHQARVCGWRGQ